MQPGVILQSRYAIEGTLGLGGMSVVYRGRDLRFKDVVRPCAIKEMYQSAPDSNTRLLSLKNFERESGMLATLQHPAIPKVYDFFEENGRIYLILELVPGKDLETVLDEAGGPLPEARVARWAVQICDVLTYLHNHSPEPIVFRDMKPSNIMVTADDRIVLIDFGIARSLTRADRKGTMIGPVYVPRAPVAPAQPRCFARA
jgi:serine/threonine protein kinase